MSFITPIQYAMYFNNEYDIAVVTNSCVYKIYGGTSFQLGTLSALSFASNNQVDLNIDLSMMRGFDDKDIPRPQSVTGDVHAGKAEVSSHYFFVCSRSLKHLLLLSYYSRFES